MLSNINKFVCLRNTSYLCINKRNNPLKPGGQGDSRSKSMKTLNTTFKQQMHEIMATAWQFVKRNGFSMSDALKQAWLNYKLHCALVRRIVKFYFQKVDGTIREAYGTLKSDLIPATGSDRKKNDTVQVYFDTEKQEYRCFKKANLLNIA